MFNLDPAKLLVILVVALIVLGPERLPKLARQAGAFWHEFARIRNELTEEVRAALPDIDIPKVPYRAGAITDLLMGRDQQSAQSSVEPGDGQPKGVVGHDTARVTSSVELRPNIELDDPSMN